MLVLVLEVIDSCITMLQGQTTEIRKELSIETNSKGYPTTHVLPPRLMSTIVVVAIIV